MQTDSDKLKKDVAELATMPTLPSVVMTVARMAEDAETTANDMADVIATDQVLSARVLRLVNSPMYGFPGRISTVRHAVVLLGFQVVKGLVLGASVFEKFDRLGNVLWSHSLGTALFSRHLAEHAGLDEPEEYLIAGLLHDLGKLVLSHLRPREFDTVLERAREQRRHIGEVEREVFQVDHARVGYWLADEWRFPKRLLEPIAYHHRPDLAKEYLTGVAVVHLSDILARTMGHGYPGDPAMPRLDHDAYKSVGLTPDSLIPIMRDVDTAYAISRDVLSPEG